MRGKKDTHTLAGTRLVEHSTPDHSNLQGK